MNLSNMNYSESNFGPYNTTSTGNQGGVGQMSQSMTSDLNMSVIGGSIGAT